MLWEVAGFAACKHQMASCQSAGSQQLSRVRRKLSFEFFWAWFQAIISFPTSCGGSELLFA